LSGRVFVSCGQRPEEIPISIDVSDVLRKEFSLDPYVAVRVQSLCDIMAITEELRRSDYYLFIDFLRKADPPFSLFTHQELALAHHLGFHSDIIALQQEGAKIEGFLKYVQGNPVEFKTRDDLLVRLRELVKSKGWHAGYSRNLVVTKISNDGPLWDYRDHAGQHKQVVWQARIENKRPDAAAVGTVCILDSIRSEDGSDVQHEDRAYLKWSGQAGYERTILPEDFGVVDLCAISPDEPGLFLHSLRDTPRQPVLTKNGRYWLRYKVFARDFPLLRFEVVLQLQWQTSSWISCSRVDLVK